MAKTTVTYTMRTRNEDGERIATEFATAKELFEAIKAKLQAKGNQRFRVSKKVTKIKEKTEDDANYNV